MYIYISKYNCKNSWHASYNTNDHINILKRTIKKMTKVVLQTDNQAQEIQSRFNCNTFLNCLCIPTGFFFKTKKILKSNYWANCYVLLLKFSLD